jgi:hypothetical protein
MTINVVKIIKEHLTNQSKIQKNKKSIFKKHQ